MQSQFNMLFENILCVYIQETGTQDLCFELDMYSRCATCLIFTSLSSSLFNVSFNVLLLAASWVKVKFVCVWWLALECKGVVMDNGGLPDCVNSAGTSHPQALDYHLP